MSSSRGQLRQAISSGDARRVRKLIEKYSLDIDAWIQVGRTISSPIALAAREGQRDIVELLLNAGANVNGADSVSRTACHYAARDGDIAMLELHAHNADMNALDMEGDMPLFVAARECKCRDARCAKRLVELGASLDDVFVQLALAGAGTAQIQMLIDAGIDVGALYHPSWGTLLHHVDFRADEATLDMLVNVCGVDMNAIDEDGNNCCHIAVHRVISRMLRWLIDAGADFDVANMSDDTAAPGGRSIQFQTRVYVFAACSWRKRSREGRWRVRGDARLDGSASRRRNARRCEGG